MNSKLKRRFVIGATAALVVGGGGATYAATRGDDNEHKALLNDAAKRLNVSPQKLSDALQGAFFDRLDAAVKAGRLTKQQADEIKQRAKEHGGAPPLGGPGVGPGDPGGHGFRFRHHGPGGFMAGVDAGAKYLGLSPSELRKKLAAGKSPAQVAKDEGKPVDGLKSAIKDAVKARLDKDVDAKRLTSTQRDDMLKELDEHIDDLVNHAGFGPRGRRGGPGGPGGPPPGLRGTAPPPPVAPY